MNLSLDDPPPLIDCNANDDLLTAVFVLFWVSLLEHVLWIHNTNITTCSECQTVLSTESAENDRRDRKWTPPALIFIIHIRTFIVTPIYRKAMRSWYYLRGNLLERGGNIKTRIIIGWIKPIAGTCHGWWFLFRYIVAVGVVYTLFSWNFMSR